MWLWVVGGVVVLYFVLIVVGLWLCSMLFGLNWMCLLVGVGCCIVLMIDDGLDLDVILCVFDLFDCYDVCVMFFCIGDFVCCYLWWIEVIVVCGYVVENYS